MPLLDSFAWRLLNAARGAIDDWNDWAKSQLRPELLAASVGLTAKSSCGYLSMVSQVESQTPKNLKTAIPALLPSGHARLKLKFLTDTKRRRTLSSALRRFAQDNENLGSLNDASP
jgi:hypothetical protein